MTGAATVGICVNTSGEFASEGQCEKETLAVTPLLTVA